MKGLKKEVITDQLLHLKNISFKSPRPLCLKFQNPVSEHPRRFEASSFLCPRNHRLRHFLSLLHAITLDGISAPPHTLTLTLTPPTVSAYSGPLPDPLTETTVNVRKQRRRVAFCLKISMKVLSEEVDFFNPTSELRLSDVFNRCCNPLLQQWYPLQRLNARLHKSCPLFAQVA